MAAGAPKTRGEASFFWKWDRLKRPKKKNGGERYVSHDINMHGLLSFYLYDTLFVNLTMIQIKFLLVEMFCF